MGESDWFFKFMCELGTSGIWAKLSKAAKAVYPMLGIHTDGSFKPVYPSIPRLIKLTGLSKKGVEDGLRDLEANSLIRRRSGKSHKRGQANRPNIYEFAFEYAGSTLGYSVGKGLATQQPSPLASQVPTPFPPSSPELESEQPDRQQQTINLNLTLRQDESVAAAAIQLLREYFDEKAAQHFASIYPADYIRKKVDLVERRARANRLRNKPAYLRRALEGGWEPAAPEVENDRFEQLVTSIRQGDTREAVIGDVAWRAGVTADQRAVYLTHMTTGAQMRLKSWDDCRDLQWR
ncbi:MAG TPA: helix-turn-helix domain-containing protein [Planctomycetota bacterium]|nr:helix-turn-helix domain-containing protein [Planctomycetota bacterium]